METSDLARLVDDPTPAPGATMNDINRAQVRFRYLASMSHWEQSYDNADAQLMVAICAAKLGDFARAKRAFGDALLNFLGPGRRWWLGTNQPHWLIDTFVLANQPGLHDEVFRELHAIHLDPKRPSLWGSYAFSILHLVRGEDTDAMRYAQRLLSRPRIRDMFASGRAIMAITDGDQPALDTALRSLLEAHQGQVRFGSLRETPEGYMSLPAMALAKVAIDRGFEVRAESEYLSQGYLAYLIETSGLLAKSDGMPAVL